MMRVVFSLLVIACSCIFPVLKADGVSLFKPVESRSTVKTMHLCIRIPSNISALDFDTEFGGAMIETGIDYLRSVSRGTVDIIHVNEAIKNHE